MKLLIATTNPGKLTEISRFLSDIPLTLVSLADAGIADAAPETGTSFEENAVQKARWYHEKSGLPTLADDGGFEIDALGGEPGVKSHRWVHGDRDDTDDELIGYALRRLEGVPPEKRGAQLRVVLALAMPAGRMLTSEEKIRGVVAEQPAPERYPGFPYRSLLYLPDIGKFYNHDVLTPEENNRLNHRKKALERLLPFLRELAQSPD